MGMGKAVRITYMYFFTAIDTYLSVFPQAQVVLSFSHRSFYALPFR